jgi:hypothetical protein
VECEVSRAVQYWEVDNFASFFQVLHSARVNRGCEDKLWWIPSKRGLFKVKLFYSSLACLKGAALLGGVCGGLRFL